MAKRIGKNTKIFVEGYELTGHLGGSEMPRTFDDVEVSGYGQNKNYLAGQGDGSIVVDGFFDDAAGKTHLALKNLASGDSSQVVSVALGNNATPASGDPSFHMDTNQFTYQVGAPKGGAVPAHAEFKPRATEGMEYGKVIDIASVTGDGNSSSLNHGAQTAAGGAGYLHITGLSTGDSITVILQDSANDVDWGTLLSFTLDGSAIDAQRVAVAGTVEQYVRANYDVTGTSISFPVAVFFVRN